MYKNRFHIFHLASNADEVSDMFSTYKSLDGPLYEKTVYGNRVTYFTLYKYSHIFILILGQTATASKTFYICAHCGVKLIEMEFSQNSTHARKYFSTPKFKVATISVMDNFYSAKFICEKSRESRSFTAVIAWEVFCYKNITLKSRHELNQDPFMPMIYTEHVMEMRYMTFTDKFSLTGELSSKFVTCWAEQPYTLKMYYKPFSTKVWAYLSTFLLGLTVGYCILIQTKMKRQLFHVAHNGDGILTFVAALFEKSANVPIFVDKMPAFRVIFSLWTLQSILFTQLYTSVLISHLIIPLPKTSITRFDQLTPKQESSKSLSSALIRYRDSLNRTWLEEGDNFKISSNPSTGRDTTYSPEYIKNFINHSYPFPRTALLNLFSLIFHSIQAWLFNLNDNIKQMKHRDRLLMMSNWEELSVWAADLKSGGDIELNEELSLWFKLITKGDPWIPRMNSKMMNFTIINSLNASGLQSPPTQSFMEEELVKCGRMVHVEATNKLETEMDYLKRKYHWLDFFKSEESITSHVAGWHFLNTGGSSFSNWLDWFFESGSYNFLRWRVQIQEYKVRNEFTKEIVKGHEIPDLVKPLGFKTGITTLFHIWGIMVGATALAGCAEFCSGLILKIRKKETLVFQFVE
ncbi:hypothetical protein Fcan01_20358 [Folsomia candida]|uniref:Uncharacterized protein n=1 Tax=Folsomia candida TaxID=158441 RepID=A0A226DH40_FOLCA|nr:hypothetical protein Fcan01_20358 [Folsomia candida]